MTQKKLLRPESLSDHRSEESYAEAPANRFLFSSSTEYRFSLRRLLIVISVIAAVLACYVWFDRTYREPLRRHEAIRQIIKDLRPRCPPDLTARQWESAVGWTLNLHANSLLFQADAQTIRKFEGRLRKKVVGEVNLATIDWIWQEYAQVCRGGAQYQRFHEQMREEIAAVGR
jgi:hypothetical protein